MRELPDTAYEQLVKICGTLELVKLLTIGRKDESGVFIEGCGLSLETAVFIAASCERTHFLWRVYKTFKEIENG